MNIFLTIFPYAKFSSQFPGKKVGKGVQKCNNSEGNVSHPCYIHMALLYNAQTSCRDMGNCSRCLMKNPDLLEVSRLQGIRNSLIYMMQSGGYIMLPYQVLEIFL